MLMKISWHPSRSFQHGIKLYVSSLLILKIVTLKGRSRETEGLSHLSKVIQKGQELLGQLLYDMRGLDENSSE